MNVLSVLLITLFFGFLFTDAQAGPITGQAKALGKFTIQNKSKLLGFPQTATDYHLKIKSENENLNVTKVNGGAFTGSSIANNGSKEVTIDMIGGEVPAGDPEKDKNTFAIEVKQKENKIRIIESYWTGKDGVILDTVAIPGFKVEGDPVYTIFNDFSNFTLGIRNLEFQVNVPELDIDSMLPGFESGFGFTQADFSLGPNSSFEIIIPGLIDPGNFLYAQGILFDVNSNENIGAFIHGHQEPIPEPATMVLFMVGILCLMKYGRSEFSRSCT